ncbi:MAG: hypothetical protein F4Y60_03475 [Boseongicola sp. SB0664_bin_43]|uniref:Uncharacterized protein n=1 Tax=Boseongicola sp. SB0664_bin_43 TaxID=2604844 RepID=A0A6B0XX69_9RHOB|nr:hypothetical protein [Boseongicola sp. SB0664_bin_43]MYK33229.1 hypothetical protein [Boseongicola sp. SB0670_bin_30]
MRDFEARELNVRYGDAVHMAGVNVSGLAGFLLARTAVAFSCRKPKDRNDMAFVLSHNELRCRAAAAASARACFIGENAAAAKGCKSPWDASPSRPARSRSPLTGDGYQDACPWAAARRRIQIVAL